MNVLIIIIQKYGIINQKECDESEILTCMLEAIIIKISKEIQRKMHKIAKFSSKVKELSQEVDQYFIDNGFDIEKLRCGNGISLEKLEYGNDITDRFCKDAEENFSDRSMWNTEVMIVR